MTHPDDLTLMTVVDAPAGPAPDLADHLATCPVCQRRRDALAQEAAGWRAALRLTASERDLLTAADLPGRLVAASRVAHPRAFHQASSRHLFWLLGGCLLIAVGWMLLDPLFGPALTWASRLIDLPSIGLTLTSQLAVPALLTIIEFRALPALALVGDLLPAVAALLLISLWWRRWRAIIHPIAA